MKTDVVVVGGGVMGLAGAYHLACLGRKVILLEQSTIPNELQASGDHARVFRLSYGKDIFYTELAVKALALWKEFQKEAREDLYVPNGMLELATKAGGYEEDSFRALKSMGLPVHKWAPPEMFERYRIFNPRAVKYAVFHPDGGMLWAQRATQAFATAAQRRGVKVYTGTKVVSIQKNKAGVTGVKDAAGRVYEADAYLFAAGPWSKELLSAWGIPIKTTRQELMYFRPPSNQGRYRPTHCPVFACLSLGYYGFPSHIHGFMKIGDHRKGPESKPGAGSPDLGPKLERGARQFLKRFMPDLAGFSDIEGKVCHYDNTPDGDFILDRLPDAPNAFVAAGFSGHGFKFAPLVGRTMAELVTSGRAEVNLQRFRITRFKLRRKG